MVLRDHILQRQKEVVPAEPNHRGVREPPSDTKSGAEGGSRLQVGVAREFVILWPLLFSLSLDNLSKEPSVSGPWASALAW